MPEARVNVEVGDRALSLSNLDKVLYPQTGFTKAQVIDYYVRVAPAMLTHVAHRGVTLVRWPNGVDETSFFSKNCVSHRPDWVEVALGPGRSDGRGIRYCCLNEVAALAWTANLAALEIHGPMALAVDIETPTMVVFDLDPGEPATITECAQVAMDIKAMLSGIGLESWSKTSGSKGMQMYVPLNSPCTHKQASEFALAVAHVMERQFADRVVSNMNKALRPGKVFIDWSQNSRHKTTIAPYSLRAKDRPTVSTPITWDEVSDAAEGAPMIFVADEVLARVQQLGDIFAPTATLVQELPQIG